MESEPYDLIIVGGGIAGSAAALRAAQYEHIRTLWLRGDNVTRKRSRSQWVANIDNMIGVHDGLVRSKIVRSLRGPEYAEARSLLSAGHEHISTRDIVRNTLERVERSFSDQVQILEQVVEKLAAVDDGFVATTASGEHAASAVVLATGVMDRQPMIRKQNGDEVLDEPRWIYPFANRETVLYCIRCEGHLTRGTATAVIGHGESAAQIAMMLHERYGSASMLLTNGEQPAWSERSSRLTQLYGIEVSTARIVDITGDREGMHGLRLADGRQIEVQLALVALGLHRVYNELACDLGLDLADPGLPIPERHVLVDWRGESSVRSVFAIGDMVKRRDREPVMKQVYTAQEYAVRAVDTVDRRMRAAARRRALGED